MTDEELVTLARTAALKAYAPYSRFHVGCAIESVDGEVVTGSNMENACYRLGVCAEQSALTAAQQKFGLRKVSRIAVSGGGIEGKDLGGGPNLHALWRLPPGHLGGGPSRDCRYRNHSAANGDGSKMERRTISGVDSSRFRPGESHRRRLKRRISAISLI